MDNNLSKNDISSFCKVSKILFKEDNPIAKEDKPLKAETTALPNAPTVDL